MIELAQIKLPLKPIKGVKWPPKVKSNGMFRTEGTGLDEGRLGDEVGDEVGDDNGSVVGCEAGRAGGDVV